MGVSSIPLGIGGGEDGVDENKGADDLGRDSCAGAVAVCQLIRAASVSYIVCLLECLHKPAPAHRT